MTWVLTVVSPTISWVAISRLAMPVASSVKTSSSRGVSSLSPGGVLVGARAAVNSSIRRRVMLGASSASPSPTVRYGGRELRRRDVFEQESARAGAQSVVDVLVEVEGGEDQDARLGLVVLGEDSASGLDAVKLGHASDREHRHRVAPLTGIGVLGRPGRRADPGRGLAVWDRRLRVLRCAQPERIAAGDRQWVPRQHGVGALEIAGS